MSLTTNLHRRALISRDWLLYRIGKTGCVGLVLAATACLPSVLLVQIQQQPSSPVPQLLATTAVDTSLPAQQAHPMPPLPYEADILDVIQAVRQVAVAQGLSWTQADYRLTPLSADSLSTLTIRTTLKGPYQKIRKALNTVLNKQPALALRELTITRPNADTPDVEAKVQMVLYLSDGWTNAMQDRHE